MKARWIIVSTLLVGVCLLVTLVVAAQGKTNLSAQPTTEPLTLNINLGPGDVPTIDPALATDTSSANVIEQLFIGLIDLDDETGEVRPELATSWAISPDRRVYTFTLRNDALWTPPPPAPHPPMVTAQDVAYGIITRTLNPATGSAYAYVLFPILNAAEFNSGQITDPNLVGVRALDTTHLQITLEYPASYILSILSLWVARPMPEWAIQACGNNWTEPTCIATNGPYRLTEWDHGDYILLTKNPTYYNANNVQIERVKIWMVDELAAWQMYLNGQLDTATVPLGTSLDPVLQQEVRVQPIGCTYYYGYTITHPPFNNPLVRKAFAAATNRQGLINNVTLGGQRPALTFTPPGIFGYVDGPVEGVGIPYNPVQARRWLAEAGYPGGYGLPPVTLTFNDVQGHWNIARYIRDSWYATLGISVTLQAVPWQQYLQGLQQGLYQVWRLGWCQDYPDANNFVRDVFRSDSPSNYTRWGNPQFDALVDQAAWELDPNTRKLLYKQAEEILNETDAAIIPIYFYGSFVATKAYLERTYPTWGIDIATWRITHVSGTIGTGGGSLTSYHGDTTITIPSGAITATIVLTYTPAYGMPPSGNLIGIGHVFDLTAVYAANGQPAQIVPGQTYTILVRYTDEEKGPAIEDTLALYYWNGNQWVEEPSSVVDPVANTVTATPNHFSLWAVFGETRRMFLPLTSNNY